MGETGKKHFSQRQEPSKLKYFFCHALLGKQRIRYIELQNYQYFLFGSVWLDLIDPGQEEKLINISQDPTLLKAFLPKKLSKDKQRSKDYYWFYLDLKLWPSPSKISLSTSSLILPSNPTRATICSKVFFPQIMSIIYRISLLKEEYEFCPLQKLMKFQYLKYGKT